MYSRKIPDSHRLIGGRSHVFYFDFKSLGTWLFGTTVKVFGTSHTSGWIWYYIPGIQRSRTPFVFEICVIPLKPVLITGSDESWQHYVSNCWTFVFVSHCILTAEVNAQMHDHCQSTCRLFFQCFFSIFSLDATDPEMYTVGGHLVSIWSPPTLLYHNWLLIRSRTPIRSRFRHRPRYYTIIDLWFGLAHPSDAKSSVISQMSLLQ